LSESKKQGKNHNDYAGKKELLVCENSLESYNQFIVKEFFRSSNLGKSETVSNDNVKQRRVLDFGAGLGSLALIWRELTNFDVECLEIDTEQLQVLKSRGFVVWESLSEVKDGISFVYSSNVLEHIEDDQKCLENLAYLLEADGRIGIYVPAFMILFSDLDRSVGHYRRYEKRELIKKVESSGLKVLECRYVDSLGFFATFLIKLFGWRSTGNIGSPSSLRFYDKVIFPMSRILDRLTLGKILGKNIFLIAQK
jgi:SAM-dependent methyltransferase